MAKRYPPAIGPLAATRDDSATSFDALAQLIPPGETGALFLDALPAFTAEWALVREVPLTQMVWTTAGELREDDGIEPLSVANVDEMLALTELTQPGPFGRRTPELGTYLGIRQDGRLTAMAGERLRLPGFTEISAVCTHPEHRGRGFARSLISSLIRKIARRGDVPFLHVATENTRAMQVYTELGFKARKSLTVAVLRREGSLGV